jgi:hypothetical protein
MKKRFKAGEVINIDNASALSKLYILRYIGELGANFEEK